MDRKQIILTYLSGVFKTHLEYGKSEQEAFTLAILKTVQDLPILWAHNYKEFVQIITEKHITTGYMPVEISFDNDLGEKLEGYDCAKWLVEYCTVNGLTLPNYTVHSANPVARENIIFYLENFKKHEDFQNQVLNK